MRRLLVPVLSSLCLLSAATASAQSSGFALDRYEPSERGSDWFANESLDLRGHVRPAFGLVGDYAYKPLVFYDANGDEQAAIVEHQLFVHLGGAVNLFDRLRLGASLPLLAYTKGESLTVANSSFSTKDSTTIGDPRLTADVRLIGSYRDPFSLAVGVQGFIPVGSEDSFASDGKLRLRPRVMGAGDVGPLAWAAQLGFNYRAKNDNLGADAFGSEATFSAAVGMRALDGKLIVGPEVFGSTVVSDSGDGAFKKRTTPLEVIIGGKYHVTPEWRVGAGVGPGLTRGVGAPAVRGLLSIEWLPEIEKPAEKPADRDGDGILDREDACPDQPGVRTDDPKTNGCPPPPADRDGDGIVDDKDACPDEPGVASPDPAKNGCPAPKDTDGDGILDPDDACPTEAGPANADPKKNGCPKAQISQGQIKILEQVQFATNSDRILPASDEILQAVLKILSDHPEITKVSVEGHTDNRGGKAYNKNLSKRRAASVAKWLVGHGIDKKRLSSAGFGQEKPIDSNETDEGRQNNRRVEFHIQDQTQQGSTEVKSK
jgi:OOP family OmpA-OmpF porin